MRTHRPSLPAGRQRGQVMVWFLAFAATMAVVFAGVYSVGQATSEKQKVVNATDAAAYSGALVEARALNLVAYTNRSVIANEVLIAQMVSLDSWTHYFVQLTANYQKEFNALSAIPYVGVIFKALAVTMQAFNKVATVQEKVVNTAVPTAVKAWQALFDVWYGVVSSAFYPPAMALATRSAAESVLQQNVATQGGRRDTAPRLMVVTALAARNEVQWQKLSKLYKAGAPHGSANDGRKYAGELILASRDAFSTNRPGSDVPLMDALFGSESFCIPFAIKFGSDKQGPTKLVQYDRWEAQDTLEFKVKVGPTFCDWGKGTVAVPQGWGRATVADKATKGNILNTPGGAGALAYNATHQTSGWKNGVKALFDVQRDNGGKPSTEEATYAVAASKASNAVRNNEALGFEARPVTGPTGSPDLKAGFAKDQIAALSEARIFFSRPVRNARDITGGGLFRADSNQEYASLYNPYWQVRLTTPSQETRAFVYGFAGLNPALELFAQ